MSFYLLLSVALVLNIHGLRLTKRGEVDMDALQGCIDDYAEKLEKVTAGLRDHVKAIQLTGRKNPQEVVFGVGAGTTATRSLDSALKMLGMKGHHFKIEGKGSEWEAKIWRSLHYREEDFCHKQYNKLNFANIREDIEYVMDSPIPETFLHLYSTFPNAKFILTERPAQAWAQNRRKRHAHTPPPIQDVCGFRANSKEMEGDAGTAKIAAYFELHNELVRCVVPKERLLTFNVFSDPEEKMRGLMKDVADFVGRPLGNNKRFPGSKFSEDPLSDLEVSQANSLEQGAYMHRISSAKEYEPEDVGLLIQELALAGRELKYDVES